MRRHLHLAILLAFTVTDLGLAAFSVMRDLQETEAQARLLLDRTAHMLAEHAARTIEAGDGLLMALQDDLERWDFRDPAGGRSVHRTMVRQVSRMPQVASAWLCDAATGLTVVENWGYPSANPARCSGRSYFDVHLRGGADLFVGDPRPGTVTGKERFVLSRAVRDGAGKVRGVVVAGIYAHYFASIFLDSGLPDGSRFSLATADGVLLVSHPEGDGPMARRDEFAQSHGIDGFPLTVTVSAPRAAVLADWERRTAMTVAVAMGALAGFGLLIAMALRIAQAERRALTSLAQVKLGLEEEVQKRTRELSDALDHAREANQAKLKFIAEVSHDLRQPLQGAQLFIDVALVGRDDERLVRLGTMCAESLEFGRRLLDELLTFAKLDAGVATAEIEEFPVGPLLEGVGETVRQEAARKGVEVRVVPTGAVVRSDPARLRQMVENIVVNAVKFTVAGRVLIGCRWRGDTVAIQVWDTGIGIPPEHLVNIFREFHQVDPSQGSERKGVGLGLSIVERSARLLGHHVDVRSSPGQGTVFTITVPLAAEPAEGRAALSVAV